MQQVIMQIDQKQSDICPNIAIDGDLCFLLFNDINLKMYLPADLFVLFLQPDHLDPEAGHRRKTDCVIK